MPTVWWFADCEKRMLLGKGWRCIVAKLYMFLQRALLMWRVPECVMTDGATSCPRWQCGWKIMLCLILGEWMGTWEERGNLLTAVGMEEWAGNGLCQNQGEASCGRRMKAGPVILAVWKYGEGQSFEVYREIYKEPQHLQRAYRVVEWRCSRHQATEPPVMLTTVTEKAVARIA